MKIIKTNTEPWYVEDYYNFVCQKFSQLTSEDVYSIVGLDQFDIQPGHQQYIQSQNTKVVYINTEHNLVDSLCNCYFPFFSTYFVKNTNRPYFLRIENPNRLISCNIYVEYSRPNIENIKTSNQLSHLIEKIIYIPALVFDYDPGTEARDLHDVITSFYIVEQPGRTRRKKMLDNLTSRFSKYHNLQEVWGYSLRENFLKTSKILVNIHQTDYHHTVEELRILPALLSGMVVVCEDSPLREYIPYNKWIIWVDYDQIPDVVNKILSDWTHYYQMIHGQNSGLRECFESMNLDLDKDLQKVISGQKT
jgi:hypothetical protein